MSHSTSVKSVGYAFLFIPPIMLEMNQIRNLYITFETPSKGVFIVNLWKCSENLFRVLFVFQPPIVFLFSNDHSVSRLANV